MDTNLLAAVRGWIDGDPDEVTRADLERLLLAGDEVALRARFDGRLEFGTAGIRGPVGAGPSRMNLAVVRQTAWGLASHLDRTEESPLVIVGHDARPDSPRFAAEAAAVLAAAGCEVHAIDRPVPTPIVAWTALARGASAAVVVTASHNPREDNGIKVYDRRAIQIIPPTDQQIAEAIGDAPPASRIAIAPEAVVAVDGDELESDYRAAILAGPRAADPETAAADRPALTIVATALHGVGAGPLERLLADAGHTVTHVPEQRDPDGTFPTAPFPNPEEPGALDRALRLAAELDADLVLANDPDADRLAIALPDRDGPVGGPGHRALTGNELGMLLADAFLDRAPTDRPRVVASSIVSSPQLTALAAHHGAEHRLTLTGFKWVWTALLDAAEDGRIPVMGYEEALGYAVHPEVRDKDGLSAALAVADLAAAEASRGRTLADRLDDIARRTGLWVSTQQSVRFEGIDADERAAALLERVRDTAPTTIGGLTVDAVTDYADGAEDRPVWLGAQNLVAFDVSGTSPGGGPALRGRILVRPSGTEPKVKVYVDLMATVLDPAAPRSGRAALERVADEVARAAVRAFQP